MCASISSHFWKGGKSQAPACSVSDKGPGLRLKLLLMFQPNPLNTCSPHDPSQVHFQNVSISWLTATSQAPNIDCEKQTTRCHQTHYLPATLLMINASKQLEMDESKKPKYDASDLYGVPVNFSQILRLIILVPDGDIDSKVCTDLKSSLVKGSSLFQSIMEILIGVPDWRA